MNRAEGDDFPNAKRIKFGGIIFQFLSICFTCTHNHRFTRPAQNLRDFFVGGSNPLHCINQHHDDIRFFDCHQCLSADLRHKVSAAFREWAFIAGAFGLIYFDPAGINHMKRNPAPIGLRL